jgi:orotate phosphoribosyltransferase
MDQNTVMGLFAKAQAIITNSHVVYASGKHGSAYVNKDALYPHAKLTSDLCRIIAEEFKYDNVEVVVAPIVGAVILSQWVAFHLSKITGREVLGVYADKNEKSVFKADGGVTHHASIGYETSGDEATFVLRDGEELVVKDGAFVIKRGYNKLVAGKNALIVEDILTTGTSARKVVEVTRATGGNVVGVGVLCNRGGVKLENLANPPKLFALANVTLDAWLEADCPLCAKGIPINTDVGKGKDFLARKALK